MDNELTQEIEKAKLEVLNAILRLELLVAKSLEGHRQQQSAEHGALFSKMDYISNTVAWLKSRWERFTRSPDPNDRPPK